MSRLSGRALALYRMTTQWKPGNEDLQYLELCAARKNDQADEVLAGKYGLSPTALYRKLADGGLPVCTECGALHPDQEHRREHAVRKRRTRASGGKTLEIHVANAIPLFATAVEKSRTDLERSDRLRLHLQDTDPQDPERVDKRFVCQYKLYGVKDKLVLRGGLEGESVLAYWREQIEPQDPEYWRDLCEEHGLDPEVNVVMVPADHDRLDGASPTPPEYLVAQIANYVLTGGDIEALLDALHPRPDEVDRRALYADDPKRPGPVVGLKTYAKRLSTVVCGGNVRSGPPSPPVSKEEHRVAAYVRERRNEGATDKQIVADLRGGALRPLSITITLAEVRRLGKLGLTG